MGLDLNNSEVASINVASMALPPHECMVQGTSLDMTKNCDWIEVRSKFCTVLCISVVASVPPGGVSHLAASGSAAVPETGKR